ncbi:MAG: hypothetical protein E6G97_18005 [Alphaproteobacteria bacterium]|nr:MAG: hypothetical protein E6G97_18005 [Alphaproteobacteria bacterium]
MSMTKTFGPDGWAFGDEAPCARLVKVGREGLRGNDLRDFIKRAGHYLADVVRGLEFKPGEVPVHVLAVGATEFWAPNKNFDGFMEKACRKHHHTFEKYAKWFYDHKNSSGSPHYGLVKKSVYNPEMHRVELVVALNGNEEIARSNAGYVAERTLKKMAEGRPAGASMSCVLDPLTPVLTATGYKAITDVTIGDLVYTHMGRWRRVKELNRRTYTGDVVSAKVNGLPYTLELTADHPMRAKVLQDYPALRQRQRPVAQWAQEVEAGAEAFEWIHAGHLQKDDRIEVVPVSHFPDQPVLDDPRFAALLGTYVAEGSLEFNKDKPALVNFTVHVDDWSMSGVPSIVRELWPATYVAIRPKSNSAVSFTLAVSNRELADWMLALVGEGATTKRVPPGLFAAPEECKRVFMGRWLDGDGFCDIKGAHWSSASLSLILQGRDLLLSMGVASSIYRIVHNNGYKIGAVEFTLNISPFDADFLVGRSLKVSQNARYFSLFKRTKPPCLYEVGTSYAYRVKEVSVRRVENAPTWNLEVEEDESYSLLGMVSHNCKVAFDSCSFCGNRARNRDEYCTEKTCSAGGLKGNMGTVLKCGHVLHADNPEPVFFDISDVESPAERTAYVLGRLDKMAAEAPPPVFAPRDEDGPSCLDALFLTDAERLVKELITLEKIADFRAVAPALPQGASPCVFRGTVSQALSSLAHRGQVLPPCEWLSLIVGDHAKAASVAPLLAPLASLGLARLLRYPSYLEKASRFLSAGPGDQSAERFSLLAPDLRKRLLLASLHDESGPALSNQSLLVKSGADLLDLAAHYSAYGVCSLLLAERNHSVSRLTRCALLAQNRLVPDA